MIINHPGSPVAKSHQQLYAGIVPKRHVDEQVIVHHVTEDTPYRLQLEIERRFRTNAGQTICSFERYIG
jgi:hypothetical protein